MYKIIVITHGHLAHGLKDTVNMFVPEVKDLDYLSFDGANLDVFNEQLSELIDHQQKTIVLCDMFGGSPFLTACKLANSDNIRIIGGVNLAMIIETIINQSEDDLDDVVTKICDATKESIKYYVKNQKVENDKGAEYGI